ncbi:response regulator [Mesorhizobium sp. ANAO-SY3R2]|uniref:response regulator n=1 Tax=Mesorhizobium sp. ANAO-SY3R2 TaxID=3166644 RepID=UPI00366CF0E4
MKPNDADPGLRPEMISRSTERHIPYIADFNQVLVVARSQINRVVVSKIVERSGLRPVAEAPEVALTMLRQLTPGTIILDGGADNKDCDALIPAITALRLASGSMLPSVILLSSPHATPESLALLSAIDVVVAKPITPERLQPVVEKLLGRG